MLRGLAQRGDIKNLLAQLDQIERINAAHAPFVAQIRELAERFQLNKINELLSRGGQAL